MVRGIKEKLSRLRTKSSYQIPRVEWSEQADQPTFIFMAFWCHKCDTESLAELGTRFPETVSRNFPRFPGVFRRGCSRFGRISPCDEGFQSAESRFRSVRISLDFRVRQLTNEGVRDRTENIDLEVRTETFISTQGEKFISTWRGPTRPPSPLIGEGQG